MDQNNWICDGPGLWHYSVSSDKRYEIILYDTREESTKFVLYYSGTWSQNGLSYFNRYELKTCKSFLECIKEAERDYNVSLSY